MEVDQQAGTVSQFHFGCRAIYTAPSCGRQRTANHFSEPLDRAASATRFQHFDGPNLVRTSESSVLDRSAAPEKTGVSWEDLPCIDAVLISHNHYDHLDLPTLRRLAARGGSTFIVPAGGARLLHSENIRPTHELDWGESLSLPGFTIHCVPALHFSSRGIYDRNMTLWCGYMIECQERLVYFAGDTAFGGHFAQIREKFGAPRLALLPIGAYEPRWFMSPVHMAPDEALRAHEIMAAKTSIAIHHGTFQLSDEGIGTPEKQLIACAQHESFLVLKNGQFANIP